MEWERAAEELTWERLLGLDGSLLFIEHVFWIISLNALFILIFGMIPYQIGESFHLYLKLFKIFTYSKRVSFAPPKNPTCHPAPPPKREISTKK